MAVTRNAQATANAEPVIKSKTAELPNSTKKAGNMYHNNTGASIGLLPFRNVGALLLMIVCPLFSLFMAKATTVKGSATSLLPSSITAVFTVPYWAQVYRAVRPDVNHLYNPTAWTIIFVFVAAALLLTRIIPCRMHKGPLSPAGYHNTYHANGVAYYLLMNVLFFAGTSELGCGLYNGGIIYDNFADMIACLTILAFAFCGVLYAKGIFFPSSDDCGKSGTGFVFDYYYGTELYPNILGWDVKQFSNCRFGLMMWCVATLSYAFKQYEIYGHLSDSMIVSVSLQWIYLFKFFFWECGYFDTMDIQHDRAGYYICWGCLVWVPSVYTLHTRWLVQNYIDMSLHGSDGKTITLSNISIITLIYIAIGIGAIYINYDADRQRGEFRKANGKDNIWGKKPEFITASYVTEKGEKKTSLLLASGYWGLSRHFHYMPEIIAALMWTPPCTLAITPYFYVIFLTILLTDRAFRDDARCSSKYGKDWEKYRERVPYKIIPYLI